MGHPPSPFSDQIRKILLEGFPNSYINYNSFLSSIVDKFDHPGLPPALILNLVNCKFCLSSRSCIKCLLQLYPIDFIMILITLRSPCKLWTKAIAIAFFNISPPLTSVLSDPVIFNLVKSKCTNAASVAREVINKVILVTLVTFLGLINSITNIRPSLTSSHMNKSLHKNMLHAFQPWCQTVHAYLHPDDSIPKVFIPKIFTFTSPCPCMDLGKWDFIFLHVVSIDILNL